MTDQLEVIDAVVQQSRGRGAVYDHEQGGPVPPYMLLYDEDNKIFKQGDGIHNFGDLPVYFNLNTVNEISDYYTAMFAALTIANDGQFLVVNSQGNKFTVTAQTLNEMVTKTYLNSIKGDYANSEHTHTKDQFSGFNSVADYNVGNIQNTVPLIGNNGLLSSTLFDPNTILSPFDSDILSYLVLARATSDTVDVMHLDYSIVDEFTTQNGISVDDSVGYIYVDEHLEFESLVTEDTWAVKNAGPSIRYYHTMCQCRNKIYMYGGISSTGTYLNDLWSYNPMTDVWVQLANGPGARFYHSMVSIGDKIYVFGGAPYTGEYYNELHVYDPEDNTWTPLSTGPTKRYNHTAAAIGTDMYIYGGYSGNYINALWKYNTLNDTWVQLNSGPYGTYGHSMGAIDGKLYVVGGYDGSNVKDLLYSYDPLTDDWIQLTNCPIAIRGAGSMVYNNKLYIFGGYNNTLSYIPNIYSYEALSDTWDSTLTPLSKGIKFHAVAGVSGHLISYGGRDTSGVYINEVHMYGADPTKMVRSAIYQSGIEPNDAKLFIRATIGEGATLNTDVIASVSRNGGNDWRNVRLESLPMVTSNIRCYTGNADFRYATRILEQPWSSATLEDHKGLITTFTVQETNLSGKFNYAVNSKIVAGCQIVTPGGTISITNIAGSGTASNSIQFSGSLAIGVYTVTAIYGMRVVDETLELTVLSQRQAAILPISLYNWVEVLSLIDTHTFNNATVAYLIGYDDNTFDVYLSNSTFRTAVKYLLGKWVYYSTITQTYLNAPINTPHSAISKYFEVNTSETAITSADLNSVPVIQEYKSISSIAISVIGDATTPVFNKFTIRGTVNLADNAPHGTDIVWKFESKCLGDVELHGLRLAYK